MKSFKLRVVSPYLLFSSLLFTLLISACAAPAAPASAGSAPASEASSPQFTITPTDLIASQPSPTSTIPSVIPTTVAGTAIITQSAGLAAPGSKGDKQQLTNADTALNQLYGDWLATTGVAGDQLSSDLMAASPSITVTVVVEADSMTGAVKEALAQLNGTVLAEAGTFLSVQLPIGYVGQLSQVPGVLAIQMPSTAPPIGQIPQPSAFTVSPPAEPLMANESWTVESIDAWANSIPLDLSGLTSSNQQKQMPLALADSAINAEYLQWAASVQAAGGDVVQSAWDSEATVVTLVMEDEASALAAKELLASLNVQLLDAYGSWLVVSSPIGQVNALMQLEGLALAQHPTQAPPIEEFDDAQPTPVSQAPEPTNETTNEPTSVGEINVVTQGVARSKVNVWHTAGYRGKNVRVAIIDTFDQAIIDDAFDQKEIPTDVLNGPSVQGVDHGIAVAEIVYDMAPQATISLNSIGDVPDYCIGFANTIENLAKQGNNVISSSTGPTFCATAGDGSTNPLTQASNRILSVYNTFYVQAAGNNAHHHFEGNYKGVEIEDDVTVHNFSSTDEEATIDVLVVNTEDGIFPANVQAGQLLQFFLRWDGGWPKSAQDYDLHLVFYDGSSWRFLDCGQNPCSSTNTQDGSQLPIEQIVTIAPFAGAYGVVISKYRADGNHFLDLLTSHAQPGLAHFSTSHSLVAASSYRDVFSVAAVDVSSLALESYSSRGPTYGPGNAANGGYNQPQLAGFANVNTYVSPGFNGTSSATPHVAGAAAVLKSAASCLTARQIGDILKGYATDKGAAGYDFEYGAGVLTFPAVNNRPRCYATQMYIPDIGR